LNLEHITTHTARLIICVAKQIDIMSAGLDAIAALDYDALDTLFDQVVDLADELTEAIEALRDDYKLTKG